MINLAVAVTIGTGIGKGIGLLWVLIDDKLRKHYCGGSDGFSLPSTAPMFYDRAFIQNLKLAQ